MTTSITAGLWATMNLPAESHELEIGESYLLAVILEWSEIRMSGFMGLLGPVFGLLAKRAFIKRCRQETGSEVLSVMRSVEQDS
jgi:hypothetical protein